MVTAPFEVVGVRTTSLGDTSYVVFVGDAAVVIDPQRDLGRFESLLAHRGAAVTHVLETHVHNDYVSGGKALATRWDADLVMPAACGAAFSFVPAFHREPFYTDGITITPLHTPGHTPSHTSYVLSGPDGPGVVFTGGSLLVGSAGRSDLLGSEFARQLAVLQFGSLQRLAELPDETGVYPTHGEGSFCTASGAGRTTSTIGRERVENPLYAFEDADSFATSQLAGLVPYPDYYRFMGPINRAGAPAYEAVTPPVMTPEDVAGALASGSQLIDARDRYAYAAAHVPGSIAVEFGDSFAPWVGWIADFDRPIILVLDDVAVATDAAVELARIGMSVEGVMDGVASWAQAGRAVASFATATSQDLAAQLAAEPDTPVLDVRDPLEWEAGHLPGSQHCYVPDISGANLASLAEGPPVWVVCRSGRRATIAAGLLEAKGIEPMLVAKGGVEELLAG